MVKRINIAKKEELVKIAIQLQEISPGFDGTIFANDLVNGRGADAFRRDLNEVNARQIFRFPTLLLKNGNK